MTERDGISAPFGGDDRLFRVAWALTSWLPARRFSGIRRALLERAGASVAAGVTLGPGLHVLGPAGLQIAAGAGVARDACLDARGGLIIGPGTLIGFESVLLTWTHRWDSPDMSVGLQGYSGKAVTIGSDAWIGARAMLMPGISVGDSAVVGAAAVVTRDVGEREIVAGNPAKLIRRR